MPEACHEQSFLASVSEVALHVLPRSDLGLRFLLALFPSPSLLFFLSEWLTAQSKGTVICPRPFFEMLHFNLHRDGTDLMPRLQLDLGPFFKISK